MSDPFSDFDDDSVSVDPAYKAPSTRLERFKGEQGKVYRIALMYFDTLEVSIERAMRRDAKTQGADFDKAACKAKIKAALAERAKEKGKEVDELLPHERLDLSTAQFKRHPTQYLKQEGGGMFISRMGKDGAEADRVWGRMEDPRTYYWSIALIYPTDKSGVVKVKQVMEDSEVKVFRVSDGMFNALIEKNEVIKNLSRGADSIANCDLKLTCKVAKFQSFDCEPAGEAIWRKVQKVMDKFLPQAVALYPKMVEARKISTAELKEKLGGGDGGGDSGEDVAGDDELAGLLEDV